MYVTKKEFEAIHAAMDMIESNSDGADDYEYYQNIINCLASVFEKAKKDRESKHLNYLVKKYLANETSKELSKNEST